MSHATALWQRCNAQAKSRLISRRARVKPNLPYYKDLSFSWPYPCPAASASRRRLSTHSLRRLWERS